MAAHPVPLLRSLALTTMLALAVPLAATPATAQSDVGVGAGRDVDEPVAPGLELQTPGAVTAETFRLVAPEEKLVGRVSIPDEKLATLVQPQGRDWRAFRMDWLMWGGGLLILFMLAALTIFYLVKGRIRLEHGRSGRLVERFDTLDRMAHWTTATSFLLLAISGLVITFGRYLLIPLFGHGAFMPMVDALKYVHNYTALPFVVGLLMMVVLWLRDNIPNREDLIWIREMGGIFRKGGSHPDTGRFNAGQKGVFWAVVVGGLIMSGSGLTMLLPFFWTDVAGMQIAHGIHAVVAMLFIVMILGHIYIGTIGMEGAFDAMGHGKVDENWAREHHPGWLEEQQGRRQPPPAPGE